MDEKARQYEEIKEKLRLTREEILKLLREAKKNLGEAKEKCSASTLWSSLATELSELENEIDEILKGNGIIFPGPEQIDDEYVWLLVKISDLEIYELSGE